MRFNAVLLDLDGTLLDTVADIADAGNAMLSELKLPPVPEDTLRTYVGKGSENLVVRLLQHHSIDAAPGSPRRAQALNVFFKHYHRLNGRRTKIYPGVQEGLRAFRRAGL